MCVCVVGFLVVVMFFFLFFLGNCLKLGLLLLDFCVIVCLDRVVLLLLELVLFFVVMFRVWLFILEFCEVDIDIWCLVLG